MKKSAPVSETIRAIDKRLNMGIFGTDIHTVAITQAANGKSSAEVAIPVPLWEIIIVALFVSIIVFFVCGCVTTQAKKAFEKSVQRYAVNPV